MDSFKDNEVMEKLKKAIRAKLADLSIDAHDDKLTDFIMVMAMNGKKKEAMSEELQVFLHDKALVFTDWLFEILLKIQFASIPERAKQRKREKKVKTAKKSSRKNSEGDGNTAADRETDATTPNASDPQHNREQGGDTEEREKPTDRVPEKTGKRKSGEKKRRHSSSAKEHKSREEKEEERAGERGGGLRNEERGGTKEGVLEQTRGSESQPASVAGVAVTKEPVVESPDVRAAKSATPSISQVHEIKSPENIVEIHADPADLDLVCGEEPAQPPAPPPTLPKPRSTYDERSSPRAKIKIRPVKHVEDAKVVGGGDVASVEVADDADEATSRRVVRVTPKVATPSPGERRVEVVQRSAPASVVADVIHHQQHRDEAYDPLRPSVGKVASKVRVRERTDGRAHNTLPSRKMVLRAVMEAAQSVVKTPSLPGNVRVKLAEPVVRPRPVEWEDEVEDKVEDEGEDEGEDKTETKFIISIDDSLEQTVAKQTVKGEDEVKEEEEKDGGDEQHRMDDSTEQLLAIVPPMTIDVGDDSDDDDSDSDGDKERRAARGTGNQEAVVDKFGGSDELCKYWPRCSRGDKCLYKHGDDSTTATAVTTSTPPPCQNMPNCRFGAKCRFQHPKCKFGSYCTNKFCAYQHDDNDDASGVADVDVGEPPAPKRTKLAHQVALPPKARPVSTIVCRYHPHCRNTGSCPYSHPKIAMGSALKWVRKS